MIVCKYQQALVLVNFGWDSGNGRDHLQKHRVTHKLPGVYRQLLPDHTLGPPITEVSLERREGAILVKPEHAASLPDFNDCFAGTAREMLLAPDTYWIEKPEARWLALKALNAGGGYALSRQSGKTGIRRNALAELGDIPLRHTSLEKGETGVNITIMRPGMIMQDVFVSGTVSCEEVEKRQRFCEKWFQNQIVCIHFDQPGKWGQPVEVETKVDFGDMDVDSLVLYSYNRTAGTYRRLADQTYRIAGNCLRFTTGYGGDILVSEGVLLSK